MNEPVFLMLDEVLALHEDQVQRYGGSAAIRDRGLLESALAMPSAGFGGEYVHSTLFEMAAAYLFHLARNHPFVDGNKRVALACALAFLGLNDVSIEADPDALYDLVIAVATGKQGKAEAALFFQRNAAAAK